jgi:hypothetical protein
MGDTAVQVTHDRLQQRQEQAYAWAVSTYGEHYFQERRVMAFRAMEEMAELAQTQGLTLDDMILVCTYVANRKAGETKSEIGDVMVCLDIIAENLGLSVDSCHADGLTRIHSLNPVECRAKNLRKIELGMG